MNPTDLILDLKGIGENRAKKLNSLGIKTILDLLKYYPKDYLDRTEITDIKALKPNQIKTIKAKRDGAVLFSKLSQSKNKTTIFFKDHTGRIPVVFYNQHYIAQSIVDSETYILTGKPTIKQGVLQIESPKYEKFSSDLKEIAPIYALKEGLTQSILRKAVSQALEGLEGQIVDFLPEIIRQKYSLMGKEESLRNIHFPNSKTNRQNAKNRLIFEELFMMQLALATIKGNILAQKGLQFKKLDVSPFLASLPFELTGGQKGVLDELFADLGKGFAINRLIQGDVGSGKTAVAMVLCYLAFINGYQSAIMVPTETLARQHFLAFSKAFESFGLKIELLVGAKTQKEKKEIKTQLKSSKIDIIIGTHALIQDSVEFGNLGLVVTDEQHRFGVRQRAKLKDGGKTAVHTLVMTATPIPRTLALIIYGDMDISIINEMPKGRQKIKTYRVNSSYHNRIFDFIKKEVEAGRQCYIICPLIEESEAEGFEHLNSVESLSKELENSVLSEIKMAKLHGKMKPYEKDEIMQAFANNEYSILISTTVIEVGINVPNATIMVVENAERFGLSQLHQLRGRVGRGKEQSYCILITDITSPQTLGRMNALVQTSDGFELSELDLAQRGPGEFLGTMQHGVASFALANLYADVNVLATAREAVLEVLGIGIENFESLHKETRRVLQNLGRVSLLEAL